MSFRVLLVWAALASSLAAAGCGSGSSPDASSSTPPESVAASTSTSATGTTATTPTTSTESTSTATVTASTTTTVAQPQPCVAANLELSFLGGLGATGHGELGFSLRNTGSSPCRTFGYPGIEFLDKAGAALPTNTVRTTHDFFGAAPVVELILSPGQSASFRIGVTHGAASPVGCTTAYGVQVIPPDDTATLRATLGDGEYECRTATVSPLRPGRSAFP